MPTPTPRAHGRLPSISQIGFGTAPLGDPDAVSTESATDAIRAALSQHVNYLDTAPLYGLGLAEQRLGEALRQHPGLRPVISTKIGRTLTPQSGHGSDGWVFDWSRDAILRSLDTSLTRLGVDRVDIVLAHDPDDAWEDLRDVVIPTLVELREQGVITAVGAGMNQSAILTSLVLECDVDVVLLAGRLSMLDTSGAVDLVPVALEHGVPIVSAGVFNSGVLATPRADATYHYLAVPAGVRDRVGRIAQVCASHGVGLSAAAIHYALAVPGVVCALLGMASLAEVEENVASWRTPVPDDLWDDLSQYGLIVHPDRLGVAT